MKLRLEVLDAPQRTFWHDLAPKLPPHLVLYGGTAIALRLGHRQSVDFDFFTDRLLAPDDLSSRLPALSKAQTLQRDPRSWVLSMDIDGSPLKLSFFAELSIGRVATPGRAPNGRLVAATLDLLATKLKALHDRIEAKDYLDIEALLRSGESLSQGIMAAHTLFGPSLNPLDTAKAVGWFKDGDLEHSLPPATRHFLAAASGAFDPAAPPVKRLSQRLDD